MRAHGILQFNPTRRWLGCALLACGLLALHPAWGAALDLGASAAQVQERLGPPRKAWIDGLCPALRVELRRSGALWLKLVYGPEQRLAAAGIYRLAPPARGKPPAALRWPSLTPGMAGQRAYPAIHGWRPLYYNLGTKQWQWLEAAEAPPAGRQRWLGGVVIDDASRFASGRDFPFDLAQAVVDTGLGSADLQADPSSRPLLDWRRRTMPNALIEARAEAPDIRCSPANKAVLDYTDILPGR